MMQSALTLATRIHRYPGGIKKNICDQYRNRRGENARGFLLPLTVSAIGTKRTCRVALHMSAYDPKRISALSSLST